jgi:hypothetical protein
MVLSKTHNKAVGWMGVTMINGTSYVIYRVLYTGIRLVKTSCGKLPGCIFYVNNFFCRVTQTI